MARTILVVEDEPTLRETLVDALEADGFRVIAAADGREALTQFRAERPDLVLLDLMLPELSGIEVTRIIRAESGVPIVMLTAKDSELDKVVGLELGADDYVTKPFILRELTGPDPGAVPAVRGRPSRSRAPPAIVDLGGSRPTWAATGCCATARSLPIKPKAFELLAFLIRHPGQVFTRDQLLEKVWGYDYAGETRTVDVHVHWLRSQIEADPGQPGVHPHRPRRRLRLPPARVMADGGPSGRLHVLPAANVDRADDAFMGFRGSDMPIAHSPAWTDGPRRPHAARPSVSASRPLQGTSSARTPPPRAAPGAGAARALALDALRSCAALRDPSGARRAGRSRRSARGRGRPPPTGAGPHPPSAGRLVRS